MKFSELSTERAEDVLIEIAQPVENIVSDKDLISEIGEVIKVEGEINKYGLILLFCKKIVRITPILLKTHREDVHAILGSINNKSAAEISAQRVMETMEQIKEAVQDKELIDFFKSSAQQGQTEQFAPSADSPGSE